jgi:hypothetical protein
VVSLIKKVFLSHSNTLCSLSGHTTVLFYRAVRGTEVDVTAELCEGKVAPEGCGMNSVMVRILVII